MRWSVVPASCVVQLEPAARRGNGGKTDIVRMILWDLAQSEFQMESSRLAEVVLGLSDAQLSAMAAGQPYSVYFLLHGVVQHNVYHAGQIALLKKMG